MQRSGSDVAPGTGSLLGLLRAPVGCFRPLIGPVCLTTSIFTVKWTCSIKRPFLFTLTVKLTEDFTGTMFPESLYSLTADLFLIIHGATVSRLRVPVSTHAQMKNCFLAWQWEIKKIIKYFKSRKTRLKLQSVVFCTVT